MSNIFRDSESLGKSSWKKWSNVWTFLFRSGLKSQRKTKLFLLLLILPWSTLLWHRCYYPHRSRDALSPVCGILFCVYKQVNSHYVYGNKAVVCLQTSKQPLCQQSCYVYTNKQTATMPTWILCVYKQTNSHYAKRAGELFLAQLS